MKVVINTSFGGFSLSPEALIWLYEKGYRGNLYTIEHYYGKNNETMYKRDLETWEKYINKEPLDDLDIDDVTCFTPDKKHILHEYNIDRNEPLLVQCIQELGEKSCGSYCGKLKIVEIPDNVKYTIESYDGKEHVAEVHRTWS